MHVEQNTFGIVSQKNYLSQQVFCPGKCANPHSEHIGGASLSACILKTILANSAYFFASLISYGVVGRFPSGQTYPSANSITCCSDSIVVSSRHSSIIPLLILRKLL